MVRDSGDKAAAASRGALRPQQPAHAQEDEQQRQHQQAAGQKQDGACSSGEQEAGAGEGLGGRLHEGGCSGGDPDYAGDSSSPSSSSTTSQQQHSQQQQQQQQQHALPCQQQPRRQLHPLWQQVLDHMDLVAELVAAMQWHDLLFWLLWLLAPSQIVALNAIKVSPKSLRVCVCVCSFPLNSNVRPHSHSQPTHLSHTPHTPFLRAHRLWARPSRHSPSTSPSSPRSRPAWSGAPPTASSPLRSSPATGEQDGGVLKEEEVFLLCPADQSRSIFYLT
jgi:hypothetical protein